MNKEPFFNEKFHFEISNDNIIIGDLTIIIHSSTDAPVDLMKAFHIAMDRYPSIKYLIFSICESYEVTKNLRKNINSIQINNLN